MGDGERGDGENCPMTCLACLANDLFGLFGQGLMNVKFQKELEFASEF